MAGPFSGAPSAYDGIGRLMTSSKSVRITAATLITVVRTRTWPGCGAGIGTSAISKISSQSGP